MICVSSICCFVRFQYDLKYWQWSPFVKKLQISYSFINSISPFSKIFIIPKWCTQSTTIRMLLPTARKCIPLLRNTDMSLFRSMILENNDLCFVNLLFCQVSIWLEIRLIWKNHDFQDMSLFQIHHTRKQWSLFRQSVVLSGFNMTWNTPHPRNHDFQDMSLFR